MWLCALVILQRSVLTIFHGHFVSSDFRGKHSLYACCVNVVSVFVISCCVVLCTTCRVKHAHAKLVFCQSSTDVSENESSTDVTCLQEQVHRQLVGVVVTQESGVDLVLWLARPLCPHQKPCVWVSDLLLVSQRHFRRITSKHDRLVVPSFKLSNLSSCCH